MNRRLLLVPLFFASTTLAAQVSAPPSTSTGKERAGDAAKLREQVDALCRRSFPSDEPGAAVIAQRDGKTILRKGYGLASVELGIKVDPSMAFGLASVTKPITAVAVMMLVEAGKLGLDDSVASHFPKIDIPKAIKVKHLLSHTSGLPDFTQIKGFGFDHIAERIAPDALMAAANGAEPRFAAGTRFRYCNVNYALLAGLVAKASGKSWEGFLKERIFEVAEMRGAYYGGHDRIVPNAVNGYTESDGRWRKARALSYTRGYGLGGLFANVDDLAALDSALRSGKLLSAESRKLMYEGFALEGGKRSTYALGWGSRRVGKNKMQLLSHGGGIFGWRCYYVRIPERKVVVAVLTNRDSKTCNPGRLGNRIAALLTNK